MLAFSALRSSSSSSDGGWDNRRFFTGRDFLPGDSEEEEGRGCFFLDMAARARPRAAMDAEVGGNEGRGGLSSSLLLLLLMPLRAEASAAIVIDSYELDGWIDGDMVVCCC